jgi:hypothetical protein
LKNEIPQIKDITMHIEIEDSENISIKRIEKKSSQIYIEKMRYSSICRQYSINCKDISAVDVNREQYAYYSTVKH